jgi:hypothetical protein
LRLTDSRVRTALSPEICIAAREPIRADVESIVKFRNALAHFEATENHLSRVRRSIFRRRRRFRCHGPFVRGEGADACHACAGRARSWPGSGDGFRAAREAKADESDEGSD